MKRVKEVLESWFSSMINKYPWITFKYEASDDGYNHRICVYPGCLIDEDNGYCLDEIDFSMKLDAEFPNNSILFSTEDELFSCSPNAKVYKQRIRKKSKMNDSCDIEYQSSEYDNYVPGYDYWILAA